MKLFNFFKSKSEQEDAPVVILIDDDTDFLNLIERTLSKRYHLNFLKYSSPMKALSDLRRQNIQPDLVLCDLHMPNIDGLHLRKCLRKSGVDIPFIFITADSTEDIFEEDYKIFHKPIGMKKLENEIEKSINTL
ncbi:MAG: response regulator [Halobacteriovoraceae bacterium]|nr:response regulator [Halobacteriovoraceae bacterium]